MKLLYIHNSLPEYRYGYFRELSKTCDLTIIFTDISLSIKIYGTSADARLSEFNHILLEHDLGKDKARLKNVLENERFDFVILPAPDDFYSISLSKYVRRIAAGSGIRVGLFWEKWRPAPNLQPPIRRFKEFGQAMLNRNLLRKLDIVWAPGKKTTEYLHDQGLSESRIRKIHDASVCEAVSNIDIRKEFHIDESLRIILYLGRLVDSKGTDILINAFFKTSTEFQNTHFLLIAGSGDAEESYRKLAAGLGLRNICFAGYVSPECRDSFFRAADIFAFPAKIFKGRTDAWGLTLNEAIQFDDFIIATDAVGAAHDLVFEENGIMVRESSVDELKSALEESTAHLDGQALYERNRLIKEQYTYGNMANDIISAITEIVAERKE